MDLLSNLPKSRKSAFLIRSCLVIAFFGSVACSHMNPYANPELVAPNKYDVRRVLGPTEISNPDYRDLRYVSTMPIELERIDEHRVRLHAIIAKIGSERDVYDAALWLAIPLVAFRPSQSALVQGAAVLGAGYGYLSTRPKEQVPILQGTVGELTCLMVDYSPYVYTTADFGELAPKLDYSMRQKELADAIENFDLQTKNLIRAVPLRATTIIDGKSGCAENGTAECDERKKIRRKSIPGNEAEIHGFLTYTSDQINDSDKELRTLASVEDAILRTAPRRVAEKSQFVLMDAWQRQEAVRRPPTAPDAISAAAPPLAPPPAPRAGAQSREIARSRHDSGLPPLRRLSKENRTLLQVADDADRTLSAKRRAARTFMESHQERIFQSKQIRGQYCQKFADNSLPQASANTAAPSTYITRLPDGK